jgi:hypothetical protein
MGKYDVARAIVLNLNSDGNTIKDDKWIEKEIAFVEIYRGDVDPKTTEDHLLGNLYSSLKGVIGTNDEFYALNFGNPFPKELYGKIESYFETSSTLDNELDLASFERLPELIRNYDVVDPAEYDLYARSSLERKLRFDELKSWKSMRLTLMDESPWKERVTERGDIATRIHDDFIAFLRTCMSDYQG